MLTSYDGNKVKIMKELYSSFSMRAIFSHCQNTEEIFIYLKVILLTIKTNLSVVLIYISNFIYDSLLDIVEL